MSKPALRLSQLCAALVFVGLAMSALLAQDKDTPSTKVAPERLREALLGAWAPSGAIDDKGELKRIKFFGLNHWTITQSDPRTGEVVFHHGGTYKLEGDRYEETIKFAAPSTKDMIGLTFKFKVTVDGDAYEQVGIGNPYNEKWKRLKAE